jgi:hypothetical protein
MSDLLKMPGSEPASISLPYLLYLEEVAAQIVALMQAKFNRPGPDEMRKILKCAEQQISALEQR